MTNLLSRDLVSRLLENLTPQEILMVCKNSDFFKSCRDKDVSRKLVQTHYPDLFDPEDPDYWNTFRRNTVVDYSNPITRLNINEVRQALYNFELDTANIRLGTPSSDDEILLQVYGGISGQVWLVWQKKWGGRLGDDKRKRAPDYRRSDVDWLVAYSTEEAANDAAYELYVETTEQDYIDTMRFEDSNLERQDYFKRHINQHSGLISRKDFQTPYYIAGGTAYWDSSLYIVTSVILP